MKIESMQKGKLGEFHVFGELIKRGFDIYLPMIDIGTDAVVRLEDGTHIDIQVKTTQAENQAGYFNVNEFTPRDNLFIICVDMSDAMMNEYGGPEVWILPSKVYLEYCTTFLREGCKVYYLPLPSRSTKHGNVPRRDLLKEYCANTNPDAWNRLLKVDRPKRSLAVALSEAAEEYGYELIGPDHSGDAQVWYTRYRREPAEGNEA